jgi:signal transduction histidine kinase/DNA-binding response OmpR family regulator
LDKDWVYSDTRRFASYPNLQPGSYTFRVKGSNNDGVWNEAGTSISLIISPPWWKTFWAYLSYGLLFLFSIYGFRRYEMNRLNLKNKVKRDEAVLKEKIETDQMKSTFFANISHEFRTPLTLILGPAEKIISNTTEEDIKKDANIIKRNSRRLLQLINQLLELSKLESGKLKLEASRGNIVSFVKGVALSFESLSESKDITLRLHSDKEFIELYFDKDKMLQILTNLLSNAFKLTPEEGQIAVSVREIDNKEVEIKITDSGIGIAPEEIPKLFDRFYQVDSSHTREYEGTGIGLALTKELVELHHGSIGVESKKQEAYFAGTGWTEFTVTLPLGRDHLKETEIKEGEKEIEKSLLVNGENPLITHLPLSRSKKSKDSLPENGQEEKTIILIVEDNYDMREYIKESLDKNYLVEEAVNGEQGVRKAEKIIPDLIISDMMMPKMDGNELVRILKNDEKTSHIPIILLTAKAGYEDKLLGLETGADDYLTKPFDLKELRVRVNNLIHIRKKLQEKYSKFENLQPPIQEHKHSTIDEKFLIRVGNVIDEHLSEEEFDVEQFCQEIAMSRTSCTAN